LSAFDKAAATPGAPGAPECEGGTPGTVPNLSSNRRLQQTQAQVEEVVDIMRVNVDKVLDRDQKLSELDDRADALQAGASQFESSAAKLKNKYWWKNCKVRAAACLTVFAPRTAQASLSINKKDF
uniref:V-SNARE coiled-coil homology domain-containing protein n=1 Tax=Electrophorus electricus TaxID=8005 RepID=A0A4W4ETT1_ELEEL